MTKTSTSYRALAYLKLRGPCGCSDVGTVIDHRTGRIASASGGGDYAAQMLLGRLKKQGLVGYAHSDGSTLWQITANGLYALGLAT